MWIVLGVLVSGIGAGYIYTKPIRELAQKAHTAIDTAKTGTEQASNLVRPLLPFGHRLYDRWILLTSCTSVCLDL
jgi:hypothetical protein